MSWPPDFTAQNEHVRVEPLRSDHTTELAAAVGDLHRIWYTWVPSAEGMKDDIATRLAKREAGTMLPFAIIALSGPLAGRAVGMTTYMNGDATNRRLEIGSTWYGAAVQRGPWNTSCKLLLLSHAFDALDCIAVEFRTHSMNHPSRRAIERLGAKLDGVLRSHMVMANGTLRDTAVYSITAAEWPAVRANLDWQLQKPR